MSALKKRLLSYTEGSTANSRVDVVVVIVDVIVSFILLLRVLASLSFIDFMVPIVVVIQCTISTPLAFLDCFANA